MTDTQIDFETSDPNFVPRPWERLNLVDADKVIGAKEAVELEEAEAGAAAEKAAGFGHSCVLGMVVSITLNC